MTYAWIVLRLYLSSNDQLRLDSGEMSVFTRRPAAYQLPTAERYDEKKPQGLGLGLCEGLNGAAAYRRDFRRIAFVITYALAQSAVS